MRLRKLGNHIQKYESGPLPVTPLRKLSLKWIEDLNVRLETIKLLEETLGKILLTLVFAMIFWI